MRKIIAALAVLAALSGTALAQDATLSETPAPALPQPVPVPTDQRLVDGLLKDGFAMTITAATDEYATAHALRVNPRAIESNPLGFNAEARQALKVGTVAVAIGLDYELRKHGHHRAARLMAIGISVGQAYFAFNGFRLANKK